ncbi:unnamed protein product [Cyprideis torosa]|uniref:alpha-amylase n=1 Tax=Cyprideis torosa TaxID=163714 RepID=A0A7R8W8G6_9CRUS|nr:unnamed protein product [Cyprideis torosa]CAG0888559.1 unnamed protein product [Cyprideis torosa]
MIRLSLVAVGVLSLLGSSSGYHDPHCYGKQVIVHLFEWKWRDIAAECERFLGPMGFCGVQVSPANEHIVKDGLWPWWQRYQPVSYKLESRSGSEQEFIDMVNRCNNVGVRIRREIVSVESGEGSSLCVESGERSSLCVESGERSSLCVESGERSSLCVESGERSSLWSQVRDRLCGVRIYVDVVVNHMTGTGQSGHGSGGSYFNADSLDFPGVPYSAYDFTPRDQCPTSDGNIHDYNDVNQVRNCYLVGLTDLYGGSDYVRQKVSDFFNHLISIGVAGFRVDAAKHMWPGDLEDIERRTSNLNTAYGFPDGARPFFYHEVIDQGSEPIKVDDYFHLGYVTEFRFSMKIAWGVNDFGQLGGLYDQNWGMAPGHRALVFVDNHDNQRGHGGAGNVVTHKSGRDYKLAACYMLAYDYGFTRLMSSYWFDSTDQGPPGSNGGTNDVLINSDGSGCENGWVCEHRWPSIARMVQFRNAVQGTGVTNYYNDGNKIFFSRGDKGFFAVVKYGTVDEYVYTGLPGGSYCNLIDNCATQVQVNGDGTAHIKIHNEEDPFFAICVGCEGNGGGGGTTTTTTSGPTQPPPEGFAKTVVLLKKVTQSGQDLFIRGGIPYDLNPSCNNYNSAADNPCAVSIQTESLGSTSHYDKYNAWRVGDTKLDWFGSAPEPGQGEYNGVPASGTPLAWTSSSSSSPGYQPLNTYGDHYWMVSFLMNCDETADGWFDFKGFVSNGEGWEQDLTQGTCTGDGAAQSPVRTNNHRGRCGFLNVFEFNTGSCEIKRL